MCQACNFVKRPGVEGLFAWIQIISSVAASFAHGCTPRRHRSALDGIHLISLVNIDTYAVACVCVCVQTKEEVLQYSKQHKAVSDAANEVFTHRTGHRVVDKHFLVLVQAKQAVLNSPPKLPGKQHKVRSRSNESRRVRSFTLMFGVDWLIAESQACG